MGPPTTARDDGGGSQVTWPTTRAASVPCLINSQSANAQDRFSMDNLVGGVTVAFNGDATVERGDLLVVVGGPYTGRSMRVTGLNPVWGMGGIDSFLYAQAEWLA